MLIYRLLINRLLMGKNQARAWHSAPFIVQFVRRCCIDDIYHLRDTLCYMYINTADLGMLHVHARNIESLRYKS